MIDDDFDQARLALKQMIAKGQSAVEDISNIARQSDNPRAYEVTGENKPALGRTGMPVAIQLALQFKETTFLTKDDFKNDTGVKTLSRV